MRKAAFQSHLATPSHPTHAGQHPVPHLFNLVTNTSINCKEYPVMSGGPGYLVAQQGPGPARVLLSESSRSDIEYGWSPLSGLSGYTCDRLAARAEQHQEDTAGTIIS